MSNSAIVRGETQEANQHTGISGCGYGGDAVLTVQVHEAKDLRSRMWVCRNTYVAMRVGETSMQTKAHLPRN